ncbi:winged helix-turn-helix transcriptional regulator [Pseudooceanicola aestuarii]|uniref:winged helix-turn-helix transcriptional regulator n=1 Tax=Pseudooceanicola aestuarii TaxID=2697319 RepID=UPI0013D56FA2|nr:helix-turn-helix domain-containing protein [Pseudooceanicola aestuarii]
MLNLTALSAEDAAHCPIRQVLSKVTGKWQMLILFALEDGALRFGALKRTIGDITQRVLTDNLRGLERDGYLTRTVEAGPPLAVFYTLTDIGRELMNLLKHLADWAARNHATIAARRAADGGEATGGTSS